MTNNMICSILEGLPDAVALHCLARIPFLDHPKLQLVSRTWKHALLSAELFKVRHEANSTEDLLCISTFEPENAWQLYDPSGDRWFTLPEMPSEVRRLAWFGATSVSGKLFVLGGGSDHVDPQTGDRNGIFATKEVWSLDLVARQWTRKADMLVPRSMFACCAVDEKIVVAGGFTSYRKSVSKAETYDPDTDTWSPLPDLCLTHDSACSGMVVEGVMHVLHEGLSTVQILHEAGGWETVDYGWLDGPMAVVNGEPYVLNGGLIRKQRKEKVLEDSGTSALEFEGRVGFRMVGMKGRVYVIGGVISPGVNREIERLSDVHVLQVGVDGGEMETEAWRQAAQMTRCCGSVFGCAVVKI